MAEAPGHLLGQYIGSFLEATSEPELRMLTDKHRLTLDIKGERPGIRQGKLLSLLDANGNKHDLDFVIERPGQNGAEPVYAAFVECAWRRYTKHSKAKAQEIQGAVLPLVETYSDVSPTPAAIVAGQWSRPSIKQLESWGFVVMLMDFHKLAGAFHAYGIDIVGKDDVPDAFWRQQVDRIRALDAREAAALVATIRETHQDDYASFLEELEIRIVRTVKEVVVYPMHGKPLMFDTIAAALEAVKDHDERPAEFPLIRFEFVIRYTNGDQIAGNHSSRDAAIRFLEKLLI